MVKLSDKIFKEVNASLSEESDALLENFLDMPKNIKSKIVLLGKNTDADIVIVNAQDGPMIELDNIEILTIIGDSGKIDIGNEVLLVNVHQYQTLRTEQFETREISFEDAKKYSRKSADCLAETITYFKSKN